MFITISTIFFVMCMDLTMGQTCAIGTYLETMGTAYSQVVHRKSTACPQSYPQQGVPAGCGGPATKTRELVWSIAV